MTFDKFCKYLEATNKTTKRSEITQILKNLVSDLATEEIKIGVNLALGYLEAPYKNPKFNVAEKLIIKALDSAYKKDTKQIYDKLGDLGDTAEALNTDDTYKNRDLIKTYQKLLEIALAEGKGSQDKKVALIKDLMLEVSPLSAKYLVRIILGTTRLGFTDLTVVDALAKYVSNDKKAKKIIEETFTQYPDIAEIVKVVKEKGLEGLKTLTIVPGIPVRPQRCQRLGGEGGLDEVIEKLGTVWAEYKFDGTRVQLHLDRGQKIKTETTLFDPGEGILVKTFTRNLEDSTNQHPEIIKEAQTNIKAESVILDGEAIGYDKTTGEFLPFQEIMQRKRKHDILEKAGEVPLKYFVFDIMYLNGKNVMASALEERHKLITQVVKEGQVFKISEYRKTKNTTELQDFYEKAKNLGLEGIIAKKPGDPYQAGARSFSWVKIKKADEKLLEDSVDVVVLGYYFGKGVRNKFGIGGFLAGVYDEKTDTYKTITKVGTGLKEDDWRYLKKEADKYKTAKLPPNYDIPEIYLPDIIVEPKIIIMLGADEVSISKTHSAGYALRFPRLLSFREDKRPEDTTSPSEIAIMHKNQKRGKY